MSVLETNTHADKTPAKKYYTPHNAPEGYDWVVQLADWRVDGNTLHVTALTAERHTAQITFRAVSDSIWRITFTPPDSTPSPATPIIIDTVSSTFDTPPMLSVHEELERIRVRGANLTLEIDRDPWCMRFVDPSGRVVCRENPSDVDGLGKLFILPLGYERGEHGAVRVMQSFHLRQDEHLYGLGEKFTPLDKRGQRIITWTQDAFGSTSERSHKNVPFMVSTRGYGILIDTGARITWDLGTVSCQSYTATVDDSTLDAYLIHGETPAAILSRYVELTGRAPVPPKWTFGLWLSGAGPSRDRAAFERLVAGLDKHDFPADLIHVDTWWLRWRLYCDFQWDREAFPDTEQFLAWLHERGYKVSVWEHSYISVESDLYQFGKDRNYFIKRPDGEPYVINYGLSLAPRPDGVVRIATPETSWNAPVAIIDFTNPEAFAWFQDLHRPVLRMGVDAFKTDFGEDIPTDAVFYNGQTGATMHNLYPLLYNRAVYEVTEQEHGHGVVWSRSGTAGNQRYPICWSGDPAADFDSLACTIRGGLSIGLSGVPFWSHDIGGYRGMPTPRLYIRWAQFGLLCSHSRMHGDSPREPWAYGDEAVEIVRRYTLLRYQLFPYLYSAAHEAHRTGMPVIRAMPLAFPDDPNTYDKDLQFMLGDSLLIAPIYDEGERRSVYLPAGTWIDYWTGKTYGEPHNGGMNITVDAPLDTMPIFVRGGAILPMMDVEGGKTRIPRGTIQRLIVQVYPGADNVYTLYEDEGETTFTSTRNGSRVEWQGNVNRTVVVRGMNGSGINALGETAESTSEGTSGSIQV
jgi:alpha-D-xyloside xylohydrolase